MATASDKEQTAWLQRALYLVGLAYAACFFLAGPWVGPYDYNHLSGYYEIAWRFWKTAILKFVAPSENCPSSNL